MTQVHNSNLAKLETNPTIQQMKISSESLKDDFIDN